MLGHQAAEMLLALLAGKEVPEQVMLPAELVVRQSCGCPSQAVLEAAVEITVTTDKRFNDALARERVRILTDVAQAVGTLPRSVAPDWAERLLDAFVAELKGESAAVFIPTLNEVLRQVTAEDSDAASWQGVISVLRRHLLPLLADTALVSRAENLWQQARVLVGETVQRVQAYQRLRAEQLSSILGEISEMLMTTFDLAELMDLIARELPRLGIPSCYVSLYEDPKAPTAGARLILGYDGTERVQLEASGQPFLSYQLIPDDLWPRERRYTMAVEALYFRENQLGFALFEMGPREGVVYETLRGQISNALQGALILEERRRGEEALAGERNLLRTLIDNLPDYIYVKDIEGRFVIGNAAVVRQMGLTTLDELVGKTDFDLLPHELAERYYAEEQAFLQSGQGLYDYEGPTVDAGKEVKERWVSTTKVPLRDAQGKIVGSVGLGRDITERKAAEAERERLLAALERRSAQLQTAAEVSRAASSILDPDELIRQVVNLVRERFGLYYAGLFLVDQTGEWSGEPGKWAVLRAGTGEAGRKMLEQGHKLEIGGASMVGWCIANKQARIALDVGTEAVRFDNPLLPETRSELALPLVSRGEAIGALTIQSAQEAAFSPEDIAVLQTMADQLANAIANVRLFEQAQARAAELAVLNEVGQALTARLSMDEVLNEVYRGVSRLMDTTNFYLALYDPDKDEITFPLDVTQEEKDKFHTLAADEGLTGYIIRNRTSVLIRENLPERLAEMGVKMVGQPAASWLGVPMMIGDRVLGVIGVQSYTTPGAYDEHDRDLLTILASQAAIAIQNARLFDEQQQVSLLLSGRVRELDCLNDIGRKIDESPPIPDLLEWVAERIPPAMQHPEACVVAVEFEGQTYGRPEALNLPRQMVGSLRVGDERLGQVYIAYTRDYDFLDEESALLGDIVRRLSGYIESRRLLAQTQAALQEVEATHRRYLRQAWSEYLQAAGPVGYEARRPDVPLLGDAVLPEIRQAMEQQKAMVIAAPQGDGASALVAPIILRGAVIGALGIHAEDGGRQWSEDEIALVQAIAERVAQVAESLRLLDETQRRAARERLAREITDQMRRASNVEKIVQTAVDELFSTLGTSRVFVRLGVAPSPQEERKSSD
jgi:PAS domain S-box-containing protein